LTLYYNISKLTTDRGSARGLAATIDNQGIEMRAHSPLAQSAAARVAWTGGACVLLWLAVWWALA